MSLLWWAMDLLGTNKDSWWEKKWLFDSLKFWDNKKQEETSKVTNETKWQLSTVYSSLMLVAKWFNIKTNINAEDFADGMNKEDDSWYEFLGKNEKNVDELLGSIVEKINENPNLSDKYKELIANIASIKDGNIVDQLLGWVGKIPWVSWLIGKVIKPIIEWASKFERIQKSFKLDKNKVIEDVSRDLWLLAQELNNWGNKDTKLDENNLDASQHKDYLTNREGRVEQLQWHLIWPLAGNDLYLTSEKGEFGDDRWSHDHGGIDIGWSSDKVIAPHTMKVTRIDYQKGKAWEYLVGEIFPETDPKTEFKFFHLKQKPDVVVGQIIKQWEVFATEWSTWRSSGKHLHFEITIGDKKVDPLLALNPQEIKYKQWWKLVAFNNRDRADNYNSGDRNFA